MAYDIKLAARVRTYLSKLPGTQIEEKKMFGGLAFLVHDKMCADLILLVNPRFRKDQATYLW